MATLDRWRRFLTAPQTLIFPRLSLMAGDHAPLIVEGSGEVRFETLTRVTYRLVGRPVDVGYVMAAFRRHEENPYDGLSRMRLFGVDADGMDWTLGWTMPQVQPSLQGAEWTFTGEVEGQTPRDQSDSVARESSTEVIFAVPPESPMHWVMDRSVRPSGPGSDGQRTFELEVLDSRLRITFEPTEHALTIVAQHSEHLPAPFVENWIGEPFRILFGQLVYPRLVARNLGNGQTIIFVHPSPGYLPDASWAALWRGGGDPQTGAQRFWDLYRILLGYLASARDAEGQRNFESNKVTRLFEEIIQASRGSKWVWALTFASAIEGLVRLLFPHGTPHPQANSAAADDLIRHIGEWTQDARLQAIARGAVERSSELPTAVALRQLRDQGVVTARQYQAWNNIRNSVMHGGLVSPYSVEREDEQLLGLASLFHALTTIIVQRGSQT